MRVVSLWLAVTESNEANGCLRVIPGSHATDLVTMRTRDDGAVFDQEISLDVDEGNAVDLRLQPGDVSVHHPNIHHSSNANTSDTLAARAHDPLHPDQHSYHRLRSCLPVPAARLRTRSGVNDYLPRPPTNRGLVSGGLHGSR